MEFTLVRGFVLFIALIGFGASTTTSQPKAQDNNIIGGGAPPSCLPSSGDTCGMQ